MARTIRWRRPRRSVTSWCITSARIIGHQQTFAGDLLLLLHLHDVMNLDIIKHIEAVKHWNALTISTAYHIPVFIEEHSNWSDTSWCHQPLWSTPSNYPCHPQCRQPSTHMFRLSHWLKVRKLMSTTITAAFQIQVEENSNQSDTSGCQQPPWYSPSNCPCHPWCRWASTLVYLVWSNMLKV